MTLTSILAFLTTGFAARRARLVDPDIEIAGLRAQLASITRERDELALQLIARMRAREAVDCTGGGRSRYFAGQNQFTLAEAQNLAYAQMQAAQNLGLAQQMAHNQAAMAQMQAAQMQLAQYQPSQQNPQLVMQAGQLYPPQDRYP